MTKRFHVAAKVDELQDNTAVAVILHGWPILISRSNDGLHAVINRCSHGASDLHSGRIRRGMVQCPLHGARFDLATGKCIGGPYSAIMTFNVRESGQVIEVEVPDAAPGRDFLPV